MATKPRPEYLKIVDDPELDFLEQLEDEDEGGDSGSEGGDSSGGWDSIGPLIDMSVFGLTNFHLMELLRQAEAKLSHGWVPVTKDPLSKSTGEKSHDGPPSHPYLEKSSEFSGIDRKQTPVPAENEKGRENYLEARPELRPGMRPSPGPTPSTAPVLKLTKY